VWPYQFNLRQLTPPIQVEAAHPPQMGCGSSVPVHPSLWPEGRAETDEFQGQVCTLEAQLATTASASVGFLQVRELSWRESAVINRERKGRRESVLVVYRYSV
jgi:hypothetical protein